MEEGEGEGEGEEALGPDEGRQCSIDWMEEDLHEK
jgi:hypothetical protein